MKIIEVCVRRVSVTYEVLVNPFCLLMVEFQNPEFGLNRVTGLLWLPACNPCLIMLMYTLM
jgi:hypothetical protein